MFEVDLGKVKFVWQGNYDAATAYEPDDVVYADGSAWVCVAASTGNAPNSTSTFWNIMAQGSDLGAISGLAANDIVYYDGTSFQRLPVGTAGQALIVGSSGLEWGDSVGLGQPIEILTSRCNGDTVQVKSGTYTFQNVTGGQNLTTGFADINGSLMAYQPPAGTTRVKYEFNFKIKDGNYGGISHWRLLLDGVEVQVAQRTYTFSYEGGNNQHGTLDMQFTNVIEIGGVNDDVANSRVASWTSAKTLKVQGRDYSSSYGMNVHYNTWWNGTSASGARNVAVPMLTITAIK